MTRDNTEQLRAVLEPYLAQGIVKDVRWGLGSYDGEFLEIHVIEIAGGPDEFGKLAAEITDTVKHIDPTPGIFQAASLR